MCEPRVTRHTSIPYSSSCHTCVNMGASIFFIAAIRAFRSARSRGNRGTNVLPLPRDLIIAAVTNIYAPMLTCVWEEFEYRIDVCRVTSGSHIEHF
jgi:hypothetical protein